MQSKSSTLGKRLAIKLTVQSSIPAPSAYSISKNGLLSHSRTWMNPKRHFAKESKPDPKVPPQPILNQYLWEVALSSLFPGDVHARDFKPHISSSLQAFIYLRPYWPTDLTAGILRNRLLKRAKNQRQNAHVEM